MTNSEEIKFEEYHEQVRSRLQRYVESEPVKLTSTGVQIGLSENLSKYLLSRFVNHKQKLAYDVLDKLSAFLSARGY